ncbi:MAG: trimeric intracellular cation channel family protein [Acidobacteria bacterium]|nr:trimeric intracellular cation channel family protein [Acidobacteriota bacterium]
MVEPAQLARLVPFFDVLAAGVFAVSGALVASRKGLDVMGAMWLAVITGVGGGTVRDLIVDVPVFWVQNPVHISVCLLTAVVMHFISPLVESRYRTLLWFDAFGLALVTIAGTVKGVDVGAPALVAIAMGAVTGAVGSIIRDTLGHLPSVLLGHEIYITASVLGACAYIGLDGLGVGRLAAMVAGFVVTFVVRGLAIAFGWSLPVFRPSAKRERWR